MLDRNRGDALLWLAGAALVAALYLITDRVVFLAGAARADGEVTEIRAEDSDCGKGGHECTRFYVVVGWEAAGEPRETPFEAGHARGYGQKPVDVGDAVGDAVPLIYSPGDPTEVYRADHNDVWRNPLIALGIAMVAGLIGVFGRRKLF